MGVKAARGTPVVLHELFISLLAWDSHVTEGRTVNKDQRMFFSPPVFGYSLIETQIYSWLHYAAGMIDSVLQIVNTTLHAPPSPKM